MHVEHNTVKKESKLWQASSITTKGCNLCTSGELKIEAKWTLV